MIMKKEITVGDVDLKWDLETGQVLFDSGDVVFFWVSAMKTFFDTIREISGIEATNLVLETTGYRQGIIVGEGFRDLKNINMTNVVQWISNTYAPAGWGKVEIKEMNEEENTFTLHIQDDWEYKMNSLDHHKFTGIFVPCHYAGVFAGLFGQNYWYKIIQYQNDQNVNTIVKYYPSDVNVEQNIHELSRRKEAEEISRLERMVEEKTKMLQALVKELSSPMIPVFDGIVVVPLIGTYDEDRAEDLIENTLTRLGKFQTQYLLLDLTAFNNDISEYTADLIDKLSSAAKLLGTEVILVGISAKLAMVISKTMTNLRKFECLQTLQHGIYYALGQSGRRVV